MHADAALRRTHHLQAPVPRHIGLLRHCPALLLDRVLGLRDRLHQDHPRALHHRMYVPSPIESNRLPYNTWVGPPGIHVLIYFNLAFNP